ncbi:hypothetical protein [Gluconacetobacter sp.]|uniref:hypothetical protein n=1 Tax=Gluconacetobacter sp. TaxID=1935994 RepID=UPI0039E78096
MEDDVLMVAGPQNAAIVARLPPSGRWNSARHRSGGGPTAWNGATACPLYKVDGMAGRHAASYGTTPAHVCL